VKKSKYRVGQILKLKKCYWSDHLNGCLIKIKTVHAPFGTDHNCPVESYYITGLNGEDIGIFWVSENDRFCPVEFESTLLEKLNIVIEHNNYKTSQY